MCVCSLTLFVSEGDQYSGWRCTWNNAAEGCTAVELEKGNICDIYLGQAESAQTMQRSNEKLCLQWNDFQQNLTSAFKDLRDDKEFTDVTLACEDGQQVEAHKLVLISSSPFFRNLLKKHKHPHPMIYMRGLKSEDLVAIIDFLYHGEANVYQENLDSFLAIAGELQLKGLHGNQTERASREDPLNPHTQRRHLKQQSNLEMILINFITINSYRPTNLTMIQIMRGQLHLK